MDPNASFEDEILSINPDYDLIFNKHEESRLNLSPLPWEPRLKCSSRTMPIISKINNIIGSRPIGELPTNNDWEETDSVEKETIAMMRKLGLESSLDQAPDAKRTISTVPLTNDVITMRNGRKKMSVFMSDRYFELKPRSETSFDTDEEDDGNTPSGESSRSEFSDVSFMYVPIPLDTTNETQETSISEENSYEIEMKEETAPVRNKINNCRSKEKNVDLSWRRRSPVPEVNQENRNFGHRSHNKTDSKKGSSSSKSSWWRSHDNNSEARDEKNWRKNVDKKEEPSLQQHNVPEPQREIVSNLGSKLFKPKELFMKKKAELIQQVFAANQS